MDCWKKDSQIQGKFYSNFQSKEKKNMTTD